MTRATVILTASTFATSNVLGGHYRSAAAIARLLLGEYDVHLVTVGRRPSPAMASPDVRMTHIFAHAGLPGSARRRFAALMREADVRAVLAFDQKSGELVRPVARRLASGFVLVKPGGGQPRRYYPRPAHQIAFMQADKLWLEARGRVSGTVIGLAPGRVFMPLPNLATEAKLRTRINLRRDDLTIVRIGRIHSRYGAVNRAALRLSARLRSEGYPARLIMIGSVQDAAELAALEKMAGIEDAIVTDEDFTHEASRLLRLFRFNVGTGRGFMEGAAVGNIMLCATQDPSHELPLLVTNENLERFSNDNFSPRINPDCDPAANAARLIAVASDTSQQETLSANARVWFERKFSAESALDVYREIIEAAAAAPETFTIDALKSELHLRISVLLDAIRS